ncbi:MAG TPA: cytochrome b/b6 domain-containing protein [Bdellovibrionota bacterium]|nr:cytochrome b/b6 domain-containing protein [Bdellovibrionota bacterium]
MREKQIRFACNVIFFLLVASFATPRAFASSPDRIVLERFPHLRDHSRVANRCVTCHGRQFQDVSASIHGKAGLLKNLPDGSLCLTCHEVNHFVQDPAKIQNYQLDPLQTIPKDVACMRCHGDAVLANAFQFPQHVPTEFEKSIHYRKAILGDKKAPLCFDCHGAHSILRVEDPRSPVHEAQRVKICAKCHAGANETFASTFDHTPIRPDTKPLEYWVITLFKILTLGTFMALGLYLLLEVLTTIREKLLSPRTPKKPNTNETSGPVAAHAARTGLEPGDYVERMPFQLRLQHFLMLASVITCVVTGWPLLSPEASVSQSLIRFLGGARSVAIIHRTAGFIMMGDFLYHLVYLYLRFRVGGRLHPMTPMPRDVRDLAAMIFYFFGLRPKKPELGEFAFHEKFDYWAVFWGVAMMGGSGLVLTFPTLTAHLLPGISIRLASIIHSDEALLAATVLFIWHFYNVHLKPGIFPMNWAWLTGRMRKDLYEHEHLEHVKKLRQDGKWRE